MLLCHNQRGTNVPVRHFECLLMNIAVVFCLIISTKMARLKEIGTRWSQRCLMRSNILQRYWVPNSCSMYFSHAVKVRTFRIKSTQLYGWSTYKSCWNSESSCCNDFGNDTERALAFTRSRRQDKSGARGDTVVCAQAFTAQLFHMRKL